MSKKTYGLATDHKNRMLITDQTHTKRKGSLEFEGTTSRSFGLVDSFRTLRAGR
jgi:hypothetical protein